MKTKHLVVALVLLASFAIGGPVIRSAAEPDYPPLSQVNAQGEADGFSVELLRAALAAMGREVRFEIGLWDELRQHLADGDLDVLPLVGRTPEREVLYDFTVPYLTLHGALFVRDDEMRIRGLDDLPGMRVAVMRGDNAEEYVRRARLTDRIIATETFDEAFRLLSSGEVDAVVAQKLMGVTLLRKMGIYNIKVTGAPNEEFKQAFCFAVTKGNAPLLSLLNEGLALVIADGTHRRLHEKWMARDLREATRARTLFYGAGEMYPPFNMPDENGNPSGMSVDLIRAVAAAAGLDVIVEMEHWEKIRTRFGRRELDVVSMLYDPARAERYDFSMPYAMVSHALFGRRGGAAYKRIEDLRGTRIAVQRRNVLHDWALEHGLENELILTDDLDHSLRLLRDGEADFALGPYLQGLGWIRAHPQSGVVALDAELLETEYCFAVHKGNADLLQQLNAGLQAVKASGQYWKIQQEWLGAAEAGEYRRAVARVIGTAIAIGLLILVLSGIIIAGLRHEVRRRTVDLEAANRELRASRSAMLNMMEDAIQAKERLETTQFALDHAADGVFWIRQDSTFAYVNDTVCQTLGWAREELLCMGACDVDPELTGEVWLHHWQEVKEKKTVLIERVHKARDGRTYPVEIHANYLQFGGQEYICAFAHDISNRKVAEQKIQQHMKDLERWQTATSGREGRVLELKKEVNELLVALNRKPKYDSVP